MPSDREKWKIELQINSTQLTQLLPVLTQSLANSLPPALDAVLRSSNVTNQYHVYAAICRDRTDALANQ